VIEVEVNVLVYTDMNTRGKRTDAIYAVCVIYGEIFFFYFNKMHINYTVSHVIASCVSLSCLCNCYHFVSICD